MKDTFLNRFGNLIKGTITGFDRIIFKGILKPLVHVGGMQSFLLNNNVLNKDFKEFVKDKSDTIVESAHDYTYKQIGCKTIYINSCNTRKEELAHNRQNELGINTGLIGTWSCLESCYTYKSTFNKTLGYPLLEKHSSRCKYIYFSYDHQDYGFMSICLQTWAPYNIQLALNGREWLKRSLDKENSSYIKEKNKFLHISNFDLAQEKLNSQVNTDWVTLLDSFSHIVFTSMKDIIGDMNYYWTLDQSEWARDYIFESSDKLKPIMNDLLYYSFVLDSAHNIFKYMNLNSPISDFSSTVNKFDEGYCFKTKAYKNSAKFYSFFNNLRFEMTINNPTVYKVNRYKANSSSGDVKQNLPLVKGVIFTGMRAEVSNNLLYGFIEHTALANDREPLNDLFSSVSLPFKNGKRVRSFDILGKDKLLLQAISDSNFDVGFISNRSLQKKLSLNPWAKEMSGKRLSSRITRHLMLLRGHGLIKKLPNQHKYYLTEKGKKITSALNITLGTSSNDLLKIAN